MFPQAAARAAVTAMADLLNAVPAGKTVIGTLPRRNTHALAINALLDDAARRGTIVLADLRGMTVRSLIGTRAEDFFHPNERGYAHIADVFSRAMPWEHPCA